MDYAQDVYLMVIYVNVQAIIYLVVMVVGITSYM
jgi:hypothetical protein